jgi:hypothetical protein
MSNFLNRFLYELLAPTPEIILTILICNVNTWHKLVEFPQKIIPHLIIECKYANYILRTSLLSEQPPNCKTHCTQFRKNMIYICFPVQLIIGLHI